MLTRAALLRRHSPSRWATWKLWTLPSSLRYYIVGTCTLWVVATVVALFRTEYRSRDLLILALQIVTAWLMIELTRRTGTSEEELNQDVLSVFVLPSALLCPPLYSLLMAAAVTMMSQLRLRRGMPHRQLMNVAVVGLTHAALSIAFLQVAPAWSQDSLRPSGIIVLWAVVALMCTLITLLVNLVLVAIAVKLNSPEYSWADLLLDRESVPVHVGEASMGVVVSLLCVFNPLLMLAALGPAVLMQRSLVLQQLRAAARLDVKTGLLNAPSWEQEAAAEVARALRTHSSLSVMLLDLDHFKLVNDRFGHLAGDEVINAVAEVMKGQLREYDRCARFGGDEFAILLPNSDLVEATRTAERIRRHVAAIRVPTGDHRVQTSVSIGIAELWSPEQGVTDLLAEADLSLYRAKETRDHVHASDQGERAARQKRLS